VHVLTGIPVQVVRWAVVGAMERGAAALLWPNGVEWDAEGLNLTAWQRCGMRGQKAAAA